MSLLGGHAFDGSDHQSYGATLPSIRTTYPLAVREALCALAEPNPSPETYARERERILAGHT